MAGTRHTSKPGRKRSCTPKHSFPVRRLAERVRQLRIAQGAYEDTCHVYRCRFCGGFHIGHTTARKYRARAGQ